MMTKRKILSAGVVTALLIGLQPAFADEKNTACPADTFNGLSLDQEFGAGTQEKTRCLQKREHIKLVMQVNNFCGKTANGVCVSPYGFGNIGSMIRDYAVTNGVSPSQIDFVVVVHSAGGKLLLKNPNANPFAQSVRDAIDSGVKVYFCQNTARSMMKSNPALDGVITHALIDGVQYVTGGLTALVDFQRKGYKYIQP